ncbi:MAG: RNA-guided pseudouridylation complex pseudouridine synthase subunit Cbf5 [Promethearchaeota archaeon]|nr:MAG: RNA-guided pseudouridylation complex pseudouridine synthase subunit Cbf5 [Candidatus Lokiarchaeota archaeon]
MSFTYLLPYETIPHVYIIKAEEPTDPQYGFEPDKRPIEHYVNAGIVNLDKPQGPTSHEVASWVRKMFDLPKTGHGGTLDPQVTGVLPIALGSATKVIRALLSAGKEYVCIMYLHEEIPRDRIEKVLNLYTAELYQRPPLKSSVARRLRTRTIYYTQLLEVQGKFVLYRVGCEAGTYIRKLCFDIGETLLCGAHMVELRRTRTGDFREDTILSLQDLNDALKIFREEKDETYLRQLIVPMEKAVKHWKKIYIRDSAVDAIAHGASLAIAGVLYLEKSIEKNEDVAIMTQKGELVAFATSLMTTHQILKTNHGLCAKTKKVFMPRSLYPNWNESKNIIPETTTSD